MQLAHELEAFFSRAGGMEELPFRFPAIETMRPTQQMNKEGESVPLEVFANAGSGREAEELHELLTVEERFEVPHAVQLHFVDLAAEGAQLVQRAPGPFVRQGHCHDHRHHHQ